MIFAIPGDISMIRNGTKTQTRSPTRGIYKLGKDYAVQRKHGAKAEPDIRIVIDRILEEKAGLGFCFPPTVEISIHDSQEEGGYMPFEYEHEFRKAYPKWDGKKRWAFKFHVIEWKVGLK